MGSGSRPHSATAPPYPVIGT